MFKKYRLERSELLAYTDYGVGTDFWESHILHCDPVDFWRLLSNRWIFFVSTMKTMSF